MRTEAGMTSMSALRPIHELHAGHLHPIHPPGWGTTCLRHERIDENWTRV